MFGFLLYFYIVIIFLIIIAVAVFYLKKKYIKEKNTQKALGFTLYEITFPNTSTKEQQGQDFKKFISIMEQFYNGMISVEPYFVLELGLPYFGDEIAFFCSTPKEYGNIFEKQVQGLYPEAKIKIKEEDYNIFRPQGYSLASILKTKKQNFLPLKTYQNFEADPLQVVINTLTKLQKDGEGAALQLIISSNARKGSDLIEKIKSVIGKLKSGKTQYESFKSSNLALDIAKELGKFVTPGGFNEEKREQKPADETLIKMLENKASARILLSEIKILVSAENKNRAEIVQKELESAFNQFYQAQGNEVYFFHPTGSDLHKSFYNFSFRIPEQNNYILLNTSELSSILHFPMTMTPSVAPQLKSVKTVENAPPLNLPSQGLLMGKNVYRGEEKNIYMTDDDRRRHLYVIGQTGTGKTHFLKNLITQDIKNGKGVCFIDPHGSDIQDVLASIPPERIDDVIYFDPANITRPMGLNMLEFDPSMPEQKDFITSEMLGIFNKLYNMANVGGPAFEQYFRNALLLVMDTPETGNTLLEITRVLTNKEFRMQKLATCKNPLVASFWREMAEKTTGDTSLANMAPYITNKFDAFLSNETMRPIVLQEKSSFNFRDIMDNKKILLVNLSKGRLGEQNAYLLGLVIVGRFLMAALSRSPKPGEPEVNYPDFYLYLDEFQNVTTDSIAQILSEARKYKLCLTIAHQFIGQIDEKIKNAVFGNVGSMAVFRVGVEDSQFLEKFYEPTFKANDFVNLDNRNAYLRMLVDGQPVRPFNITTLSASPKNPEITSKIAEISLLKFGRPREEVENEIREKYLNKPQI